MSNWLIPIGSFVAAIYVTVWSVQNGNPNAVWFWCDMLNLCAGMK